MKTKLTLLILLFICATGLAQNEFNYKAVIQDDAGNLISNQSIDVQFSILEDEFPVYSATHTTTTDANGLIDSDTIVIGDNFTVICTGGSATGNITSQYGGSRIIFTSNETYFSVAPCFTGGFDLRLWGSGSNPILDTNDRRIDGNLDGFIGGQFDIHFDYVC